MKPQHVLIDGYNLLGAMGLPPLHHSEAHREKLILQLGLYGQRIGCPVTVVFDAWGRPGQLRQVFHRSGVTVMYSEGGEKADQVIQQLVRSEGKKLAVVSSDHEIVAVAKSHGAFTIRSEEFSSRLSAPRGPNRPAARPRQNREDDGEAPTGVKDKKGNPKKLPKKIRLRNRIMKKF